MTGRGRRARYLSHYYPVPLRSRGVTLAGRVSIAKHDILPKAEGRPSTSVSSTPSSEGLLAIQTACAVPPYTPVLQRRLYDLNELLPPHLCCSVLFPCTGIGASGSVRCPCSFRSGSFVSVHRSQKNSPPRRLLTYRIPFSASLRQYTRSSLSNPRQTLDGTRTAEGHQGRLVPTHSRCTVGGSDKSTRKESKRN